MFLPKNKKRLRIRFFDDPPAPRPPLTNATRKPDISRTRVQKFEFYDVVSFQRVTITVAKTGHRPLARRRSTNRTRANSSQTHPLLLLWMRSNFPTRPAVKTKTPPRNRCLWNRTRPRTQSRKAPGGLRTPDRATPRPLWTKWAAFQPRITDASETFVDNYWRERNLRWGLPTRAKRSLVPFFVSSCQNALRFWRSRNRSVLLLLNHHHHHPLF